MTSINHSASSVKDYDYFEALRRPFLSLSPNTRQNSTIANRFLEPVRNGFTDPNEIVSYVSLRASNYVRRSGPSEPNSFLADLHNDDEAYEAALLMARWAVEWNALPKRDRDRIKYEQSKPYVEAWNEGFYAWNTLLNEGRS